MSEKIYACLLRLYPSHFREAYGDDALQLFRDRLRDERGVFRWLRLWLDLLADLALSLPREHRHSRPSLAGAAVRESADGLPGFSVLEDETLRPGALLLGSAVSLAVFGVCSFFLGQAGTLRVLRFSVPSGQSAQEAAVVSAAERRLVVSATIANLKRYYVDAEVAQQIADTLQAHENGGDYSAVTDGKTLAALLTKQMREVSHDTQLEVVYSENALPNRPPGPSPEGVARYRKAMEDSNCTFETVEMLPHNVGYLKLNSFPDTSVCEQTARRAMTSLNSAEAIIFDLRDNRGGFPDMVKLMAAYLFDHPEYLYNPRENTSEQSWTQSPVAGNRLADKPVYVLTSARTISGAEQFSYDLKVLKRATIVGETTAGAAHAGTFHRLDDHFGMGIRETRAINPFSKHDWDGTGVAPDVKVTAEEALATAERLALGKAQNR